MINLPDAQSIIEALSLPLEARLHTLIAGRLRDAVALGLIDLTHILVVQPGDTEADIVEAIGFSTLISRIDGELGEPDYDWIEHHDGWTELIYTVGDSGFAFIVLIDARLAFCTRSTDPSGKE